MRELDDELRESADRVLDEVFGIRRDDRCAGCAVMCGRAALLGVVYDDQLLADKDLILAQDPAARQITLAHDACKDGTTNQPILDPDTGWRACSSPLADDVRNDRI